MASIAPRLYRSSTTVNSGHESSPLLGAAGTHGNAALSGRRTPRLYAVAPAPVDGGVSRTPSSSSRRTHR